MKTMNDSSVVQLGVEVFVQRKDLKSMRFGMLTNALATTSELVPSVDALMASGFQIAALFVPEHAFTAQQLQAKRSPVVTMRNGKSLSSAFMAKPLSHCQSGFQGLTLCWLTCPMSAADFTPTLGR